MLRLKARGFAVIELIVVVVVLAIIGLVVYVFISKNDTKHDDQANQSQSQQGQNQSAQANCDSQPELQTPVDLSKATGVLYPGQYRGNEYKAHGAFRFDNSKPSDITVKAPLDAKLERASRYNQGGDVQILLEFTNACGIAYRFDHVLTVASKLQPVIDALPSPTDDSHTQRVEPPVEVKAGETIAIAIGSPATNNVFVDFGVYDTKHKNKASEDPAWAKEHGNEPNNLYAVCWFSWLPTADAAKVKALPAASQESGSTSDYCK